MKTKIATLLVILLFGFSSVSMAGDFGPEGAKKKSKQAARNISMLQEELDDPYGEVTEAVYKEYRQSSEYAKRCRNLRMMLEEEE